MIKEFELQTKKNALFRSVKRKAQQLKPRFALCHINFKLSYLSCRTTSTSHTKGATRYGGISESTWRNGEWLPRGNREIWRGRIDLAREGGRWEKLISFLCSVLYLGLIRAMYWFRFSAWGMSKRRICQWRKNRPPIFTLSPHLQRKNLR